MLGVPRDPPLDSTGFVVSPSRAGLQQHARGDWFLGLHAPNHSWAITEIWPLDTFNRSRLPMTRAMTWSGFYWCVLGGLLDGEYEYIYEVAASDGSEHRMRLADPLSRRIVGERTRITIGRGGAGGADDFTWSEPLDRWRSRRPSLARLVLYELHVEDFAAGGEGGGGSFVGVERRLPYLASLGINAVQLMPIYTDGALLAVAGASTTSSGRGSWGYAPYSHTAVEARFGTPSELKQLVDAAHASNISVLLDFVVGHMYHNAPLFRLLPRPESNPYFRAPTVALPNARMPKGK